MAKHEAEGLFVPKKSFVVFADGVRHVFRGEATVVRENHPLMRGREAMFRPLRVHYETGAEVSVQRTSGAPNALAVRQALVARARALGLPASGKSAELEARIADAEAAANQ